MTPNDQRGPESLFDTGLREAIAEALAHRLLPFDADPAWPGTGRLSLGAVDALTDAVLGVLQQRVEQVGWLGHRIVPNDTSMPSSDEIEFSDRWSTDLDGTPRERVFRFKKDPEHG